MNWTYIVFAFLSLFCLGLADNARGPIFPDLLLQFRLSDTMGALFFLVASGLSLVNNTVSRFWLKRWGAFLGLRVFLLVMALGLLLMGLSDRYLWLLCGASIFGVGMGGVGISQNLLVAEGASEKYRRQAFSGMHSMYGLASLLAPAVVTALQGLGWGWQQVLMLLALVPFSLAVASAWVGRRQRNARESSWTSESVTSNGDASGSEKTATAQATRHLERKAIVWAAVVGSLYVGVELMVSTRLTLFARRDWGYSPEKANQLLGFFFTSLFLGRLIMALTRLSVRNRTLLVGSLMGTILFFVLGIFINPVYLALTGGTMSIFFPVLLSLIAEEFSLIQAEATRWLLTTNSLVLMGMHFVVGQLSDAFGLKLALSLGPLMLCLSLGVLLFVKIDWDENAQQKMHSR